MRVLLPLPHFSIQKNGWKLRQSVKNASEADFTSESLCRKDTKGGGSFKRLKMRV